MNSYGMRLSYQRTSNACVLYTCHRYILPIEEFVIDTYIQMRIERVRMIKSSSEMNIVDRSE